MAFAAHFLHFFVLRQTWCLLKAEAGCHLLHSPFSALLIHGIVTAFILDMRAATLPALFRLAPDLVLTEIGSRTPLITLTSALFIPEMLTAQLPNPAKITCRKRCGGQILRTSFAIKHLFDVLLVENP